MEGGIIHLGLSLNTELEVLKYEVPHHVKLVSTQTDAGVDYSPLLLSLHPDGKRR